MKSDRPEDSRSDDFRLRFGPGLNAPGQVAIVANVEARTKTGGVLSDKRKRWTARRELRATGPMKQIARRCAWLLPELGDRGRLARCYFHMADVASAGDRCRANH
jgi:hypothetical protein